MDRLLRGALSGLGATLPMTLVLGLGRLVGAMVVLPPAQVTANVAERAGVHNAGSSQGFTLSWLAAHFGLGAVLGVLYSLARPSMPRPPALAGLAFGAAVYLVSYVGVMPALDLYPSPRQDRPGRVVTMPLAHVVFGVTLGLLERQLNYHLGPLLARTPLGEIRRVV
ncbi:MAG: DUF6789 family protein [Chloroflexota bacterium]